MLKKFHQFVGSMLIVLSISSLTAGAVSSQSSGYWDEENCTITITSTCNESFSSAGVYAGGVIASSKVMETSVLGGYADLYNQNGYAVVSSNIATNGSPARSINFITRAYNVSGTYYGVANSMCYSPLGTFYASGPSTPKIKYSTNKSFINASFADEPIAINQNGETYGFMAASMKQHESLDLIAAIGNNGISGYIKTEDRIPQFSSYEDFLDYESEDYNIPLYASDGVTILDTYTICTPIVIS